MSLDNSIAFWQRVQTDTQLQKSINQTRNTASENIPQAVANLANQMGFTVTGDELKETESVVAFWQRVHTDRGLREKVGSAQEQATAEDALHEVADIAHEAGFAFSKDALATVTQALTAGGAEAGGQAELTDAQLEGVAGGYASSSVFLASYNAALSGRWAPNSRIGPGVIASWC